MQHLVDYDAIDIDSITKYQSFNESLNNLFPNDAIMQQMDKLMQEYQFIVNLLNNVMHFDNKLRTDAESELQKLFKDKCNEILTILLWIASSDEKLLQNFNAIVIKQLALVLINRQLATRNYIVSKDFKIKILCFSIYYMFNENQSSPILLKACSIIVSSIIKNSIRIEFQAILILLEQFYAKLLSQNYVGGMIYLIKCLIETLHELDYIKQLDILRIFFNDIFQLFLLLQDIPDKKCLKLLRTLSRFMSLCSHSFANAKISGGFEDLSSDNSDELFEILRRWIDMICSWITKYQSDHHRLEIICDLMQPISWMLEAFPLQLQSCYSSVANLCFNLLLAHKNDYVVKVVYKQYVSDDYNNDYDGYTSEGDRFGIDILVSHALDTLGICIVSKDFVATITSEQIKTLILLVIEYIQLSHRGRVQFIQDPNAFISIYEDEDEYNSETQSSLRHSGSQLIGNMYISRNSDSIQILLSIIQSNIIQLDELLLLPIEQMHNINTKAYLLEACLWTLGNLHQALIKSITKSQSSLGGTEMINFIELTMQSLIEFYERLYSFTKSQVDLLPWNLLLLRSYWLFTKYCKLLDISHASMHLQRLLELSSRYSNDCLSYRLIIFCCIHKLQTIFPLILSNQNAEFLLLLCIQTMIACDSRTIYRPMQCLQSTLKLIDSNHLYDVINWIGLSQLFHELIRIWWNYWNDPMIAEELFQLLIDMIGYHTIYANMLVQHSDLIKMLTDCHMTLYHETNLISSCISNIYIAMEYICSLVSHCFMTLTCNSSIKDDICNFLINTLNSSNHRIKTLSIYDNSFKVLQSILCSNSQLDDCGLDRIIDMLHLHLSLTSRYNSEDLDDHSSYVIRLIGCISQSLNQVYTKSQDVLILSKCVLLLQHLVSVSLLSSDNLFHQVQSFMGLLHIIARCPIKVMEQLKQCFESHVCIIEKLMTFWFSIYGKFLSNYCNRVSLIALIQVMQYFSSIREYQNYTILCLDLIIISIHSIIENEKASLLEDAEYETISNEHQDDEDDEDLFDSDNEDGMYLSNLLPTNTPSINQDETIVGIHASECIMYPAAKYDSLQKLNLLDVLRQSILSMSVLEESSNSYVYPSWFHGIKSENIEIMNNLMIIK